MQIAKFGFQRLSTDSLVLGGKNEPADEIIGACWDCYGLSRVNAHLKPKLNEFPSG